MNIIYAMIIVFFISIIEAIGLTVLKLHNKFSIIIASIIYGILVVPVLNEALEFEGIGMVNFIWNIFSTLIVFLIGIYMFDEQIENKQLIGICLSLAGLFLILVPNK